MPTDARRYQELSEELTRRKKEALAVYRPTLGQDPFHRSTAGERIVRGGKRSGKSMSVAMEFGSIVTGIPIIGRDGKPIAQARPTPTQKYNRLYWIIGWGVSHIGQTIHKLLFQPGMGGTFRVIRDLNTGEWRTWDRTDPHDVARVNESEPAGPIIPERLIKPKSWVWNSSGGGAAGHCFESVELINGAKIFAFPSSARQAKQGDAVSGIWIDEDIQNPEHLSEWQDRLGDENGWMMWSVWPHTKNSALIDLLDRAEEDEEKPESERSIEQFQLIFSENPFITEQAKTAQLGRMGDDDSIARRDRGELLLDQLAMYDFNKNIHVLEPFSAGTIPKDPSTTMNQLRRLVTVNKGCPKDWTRYLSVDPSNTRTAVLSFCVPPSEYDGIDIGDLVVLEWELTIAKASAKTLAQALAPRMQGSRYEAFIMDQQMGRATQVGSDMRVFDAYEKEFRAARLVSRQTMSGFIPGCNVPQTRYREVRDFLAVGPKGIPRLMLLSNTPATQREFSTYRKKQVLVANETVILDEPANPRKHDCMSALEYGVTHVSMLFMVGGAYVPTAQYRGTGSAAYQQAMKLRQQQNQQNRAIHFGPGASPASTPALVA